MPKAKTLIFSAPFQVEIHETNLPALRENEVFVEAVCSAISAGTEMLVYRGQFPREEPESHDALSGDLQYPLPYGYACVGIIMEAGKQVDRSWLGKTVFAFQPHTSGFIATLDSLIPVPDNIASECACFLPNMETAVNFLQDAMPILGERVLVMGQGIVGLLTTALLSEFPLEALVTTDNYELRRKASLESGSSASLDPSQPTFHEQAQRLLESGADLTLELCGSPSALNDAIALTRFSGRVVIGSWYGDKKAPIHLGGSFHRSRIKLISSQVSTISPDLSGRWDKSRRFEVAWKALERIGPEKWITHRYSIDDASRAYEMLDKNPQETIQVLFDYQT
jgi:2-desacetyl-2-hydroxyethyl bacteriochlorophyllide A dehydrogenase